MIIQGVVPTGRTHVKVVDVSVADELNILRKRGFNKMRYFYLSNKEVTELDGSEAWAIVEEYTNKHGGTSTHLYQIGFKDKQEAIDTIKRVIANRGGGEE